ITAIIGPNGAGKTTLFSIISGFNTPSAGQVFLNDEDVTGLAPELIAKRGLIRTFQLVQLFDELDVLENVKVGRHLHTRGGLLAALMPRLAAQREAEVEVAARELLMRTGLADYAQVPAAALPYGQKRLLEIARALAAEPKLLLLDEPAAGLNREETQRLAELLRAIASIGTAVLLIEHDMSLVMNVAARIAVLDFGRVIANGTPAEVRRNPDVIAAYLGQAEAALA
ncbi:MAG TPA: ABC transporter ATP-binding protein, partial [Xanthobacteraceae bacterium]|nr:ABC transporter ATP-binding protein [Xanthobacteraceae bacterium]